jgi:hypothetical protein
MRNLERMSSLLQCPFRNRWFLLFKQPNCYRFILVEIVAAIRLLYFSEDTRKIPLSLSFEKYRGFCPASLLVVVDA